MMTGMGRSTAHATETVQLVCASDETVVSSNLTPCEEIFISEYLTEFDGTKKNFDEVDYLFEIIYDDDYEDVINGKYVDKEQLRKIHARHFSHGSRVSIIHFERGVGSMFVNYRLSNDKNDMFIQSSVAIEANKFKRARTLDASFGKFLCIQKQASHNGKGGSCVYHRGS
ncbi:hypothetical protein ACHAWT_005582 [Skeletonema menzelii]|eukprot:scaffold15544_cov131-Skeletonema_menzelii.AAC.4